jgi:hypothetical protein
MFRSHESGARIAEDIEVADQAIRATIDADCFLHLGVGDNGEGAEGRLFALGQSTFSATLAKSGAFYFGTLGEEAWTVHNERALTCWDPAEVFGSGWGVPGALPATYDWSTGECANQDGETALNQVPIEFVRETGFGACADLRGVDLNGDDFGYPTLSWWSLQGANLDGANLFFAELEGAALHGTRMKGLNFGYANIQGSVDDFTDLPEHSCTLNEGPGGGSCHFWCPWWHVHPPSRLALLLGRKTWPPS